MSTTRWLVLDGVTSPCTEIDSSSALHDWRIVLVTSRKSTVKGCSFPRCILLNEKTLKLFMAGFATTRLLEIPTKLSGFLLAISQGAEFIVDAKCDYSGNFSITRHPLWVNQEHQNPPLHYNESILFNPFQHLDYDAYYPKLFDHISEFSLMASRDKGEDCSSRGKICHLHGMNADMYYIKDVEGHFIWQSVSASHAACDARYPPRNLHGVNDRSPSISPVSVGLHTIAPLDTGFTLFPSKAFLWMFVPIHLSHEFQEIFRTLLMHAVRYHLSMPVNYIDSGRFTNNTSCPSSISNKDSAITVNLNTTMDIKNHFHCIKSISIKSINSSCALQLIGYIVKIINGSSESSMAKNGTFKLFHAWLEDLKNVGKDLLLPKTNKIKYIQTISKNTFKIKYSIRRERFGDHVVEKDLLSKNVFDYMHSVCKPFPETPLFTFSNWNYPLIEDIMLVIVLNYASLFKTLPYLEYTHRSSFKHILYCGPNVEAFNEFAKGNGFSYVSYVAGFTHEWYFMYECMTHAMKLGAPVRGYLQIGDDVLLNTKQLLTLPRDKILMPKGFTKRLIDQEDTGNSYWFHWTTAFGRSAILNSFKELKDLTSKTNTSRFADESYVRQFAKRFLDNYDKNMGMKHVIHRAIDMFYMPSLLKDDYILASELFRHHKCMIELAIPVIHLGLVPKNEIVYLQGASLWGKDRNESWKFFNEQTFFLHPFKSLSHLKSLNGRKFFCQSYLPNVVLSGNDTRPH